jgi:hypothetical protein
MTVLPDMRMQHQGACRKQCGVVCTCGWLWPQQRCGLSCSPIRSGGPLLKPGVLVHELLKLPVGVEHKGGWGDAQSMAECIRAAVHAACPQLCVVSRTVSKMVILPKCGLYIACTRERSPHLSLAAALDLRVVISLVACNEQHVNGADRKRITPSHDEMLTYRIDMLLLHLELVPIPAVALRFSDGMRQCGAVYSRDGKRFCSLHPLRIDVA